MNHLFYISVFAEEDEKKLLPIISFKQIQLSECLV